MLLGCWVQPSAERRSTITVCGVTGDGRDSIRIEAIELLDGMDHPTALAARNYLVKHHDGACRDSQGGGHLTGSAMVVSADGQRTLLTLHPRHDRWMQLGGHFEPGDHSLTDAVARECREESGLCDFELNPVLLSVGVFPNIACPSGSRTTHYDMRFLVRATGDENPSRSDESLDLAWFPLDDLPWPHDDDLESLARVALERLAWW